MITVVENNIHDRRGQALFEFLFLLPLLLGVTMLLVKANMALQVSIVDQQYARAMALFISYHSPYFPAAGNRPLPEQFDYVALGVSQNSGPPGESYIPEATLQSILRPKQEIRGDNAAQSEPDLRGIIRVRNGVFMCTDPNIFPDESGKITFCRRDTYE